MHVINSLNYQPVVLVSSCLRKNSVIYNSVPEKKVFQRISQPNRTAVLSLVKCFDNHEIKTEMVFVKVLAGSVRTLLFLIILGKGFASVQEEQKNPNGNQEMQEAYSTPRSKTGKDFQEESEAKSKKAFAEKNTFVYRTQQYNESMEKIQLTDNGIVMKSSYIPIIQYKADSNSSDTGRETQGDEAFEKNRTISVTEAVRSAEAAKENFVTKNGKKYKIVKVKKTMKNTSEDQVRTQIQRRTFRPLPSLLSIIPLKWMTRRREGEVPAGDEPENESQWSKVISVGPSEETSTNILEEKTQAGDKIKKLLNLFTLVQFGNEDCHANGVEGKCLHRVECEAKGGKFEATCAGELGVCCYSEKTCGGDSRDNSTYFINEGFPETTSAAPKVCTLTLEKASPQVKQLRLDFLMFQLREPTNGTCLHDRLIVSGQDANNLVPEICGVNTGQHIYVDVEDSNGPFVLNIITMGEYFPRNFRIRVTQVKKEDELMAPKNCLQYYAEPYGYIRTFNYQDNIHENLDAVFSGYFNNLNYAICFKKNKDFCSISYENEETASGYPTFQLVNIDEDGERLLPPNQAGAETFDCPDDYIVIQGIRLCGEKLNDATFEVDYTRNFPVTDNTNGPFVLYVRTDGAVNGRGFNLKYRQHPCPT